jgi:hypothetical protein
MLQAMSEQNCNAWLKPLFINLKCSILWIKYKAPLKIVKIFILSIMPYPKTKKLDNYNVLKTALVENQGSLRSTSLFDAFFGRPLLKNGTLADC